MRPLRIVAVCISLLASSFANEHTDGYGDRLPDGAVTRMGTVRLRHTSLLTGVAFSPDGQVLASTGWDHPIRLWETASGKPIKQLTGTIDRGTFGAAFSPDGSRLASVGEAGLVRLWDVESGKEIWKTERHKGRTYGVAFSPDGYTIASAGGDGTVRIWDVVTGVELLVLNPPERVIDSHAVTFSPDGSLLACASSKQIHIYDLDAGGEPSTIKDAHGGEIFALVFTADGTRLASGGRSAYKTKTDERGQRIGYSYAEAKLWSVENQKLIREFGGKEQQPSSTTIALSRNGNILASLHHDRIQVWNASSGRLLYTFPDYYNSHGPRTHGIAISPDGNTVAAIGPDHAVMMWSLETGTRELAFPDSHEGRVDCVASSPNSEIVASGARDGTVRLWNSTTGKLIRMVQLGTDRPQGVHAVAFSPDGNHIAAGGYDWKDQGRTGIIEAWSVAEGTCVWSRRVQGRVTSLGYSMDGKKIAAAAGLGNRYPGDAMKEPTLLVCSAMSGEDEHKWQGPKSRVKAMSFSRNSTALMVVEEAIAIASWSVESQERLREFSTPAHRRSITSAAFFPDGRTVVSSGIFDDVLAFWDAASGKEARRITVENTMGSIVAISPDGSLLASGGIGLTSTVANRYDRAIHFWNASSGEHLGQVEPGSASVTALSFSPDGKHLFSGMNDGTLLVWPIQGVN